MDFFDALEAAEASEEAKKAKTSKKQRVVQVIQQHESKANSAATQAIKAAQEEKSASSSSSSSSSSSGARQNATMPGQANNMYDENDEEDELLEIGNSRGVIKGVQYYTGVAHVGEYVSLRREPTNPYDRNAIEVLNLNSSRIGHLAKETAAVLAGALDRKIITIEASIPRPSGTYTQDVELTFFALPENVAAATEHFRRYNYNIRQALPPSQVYSSSSSSSSYAVVPRAVPVPKAQVVAKKTTVTTSVASEKSLEKILDTLGFKKWAPINQAQTCGPVLTSTLFQHQLEGVAFLLARELDKELPPFWSQTQEKGKTMFINTITSCSQSSRPASVQGGCLLDSQGLGKSLMVLALILAHPPTGLLAPPTPGCLKTIYDAAQVTKMEEGWQAMSGAELQAACKKIKINQQGTKAELVEKLVDKAIFDSLPATVGDSVCKTTLIVCPVSVISAWMDQIEHHLFKHSVRFYNYSGAGRLADIDFLLSMDIVLVSYQTLAQELSRGPPEVVGKKRDRGQQGILNMKFWRVVLDESHTIRNRQTQMFKAVSALQTTNSWCLSGTPVQNKIDDAFPIFNFLKAEPCSSWDVFNRAISRPMKSGDTTGLTRLRAFLSTISLRRGKSTIADHLPERTIEIHSIKMSTAQKKTYESIFDSARLVVQAALQAQQGDMTGLYSGVLECILRLRQSCCDTSLISAERIQAAASILAKFGNKDGKAGKAAAQLSPAEAAKLFKALQGALDHDTTNDNDCCVCLDPLQEDSLRLLRTCRHTLCHDCCNTLLAQKDAATLCPLCRTPFSKADILQADEVREAAGVGDGVEDTPAKSQGSAAGLVDVDAEEEEAIPPKIVALLQGLEAMRTEQSSQKAVVFSQFTKFLDVIGKSLKRGGLGYSRIDGSMTQKKRAEELAAWRLPNAQGGVSVLVISTRAGGQGLNLVEGNKCFMMDPQWSAAAEEQAMDRIYRLGQTRPVSVVRFIHEGSIEEKIVKLQESKAAINKGALTKLSEEEMRRARLAEMKTLFEL